MKTMNSQKFRKKITIREIILYLIIASIGIFSIRFIWMDKIKEQSDQALQIARSVEASLPVENILKLTAYPADTATESYKKLKEILQGVIELNPQARLAYLYLFRDGKLYFMADSEPEGSPTMSSLFAILVPGILVIILLLLIIAVRFSLAKNNFLKHKIQEHEIAENRLNESKRQLANLVGNLPGIIYRCALDEDYSMEFISDGCLQITGYSPEEFVTKKTIAFNDLIFPEYRNPVWQNRQLAISEKRVFEVEYPIKTASGETKWLCERGGGVFNENGELQFLEGYIDDITGSKLSEEKLGQSEANFNRSIEESPFGVRIISDDGQTIYANPTLLHIFGFESLDDFSQIPETNWYTPESYSEHLIREEKRKNGEPVETEYEISITRTNLDIRYLQVFQSDILWNGEQKSHVIYLDITERKLAENQLRKLSRAVEQNPVSIIITDSAGVIEYVNPKFTDISGYEAAEVIGKNLIKLQLWKIEDQTLADIWTTINSGKIWKGDVINENKKGQLYWVDRSISPILDSKERITNFVLTAEDITEKKKKEEELIDAKEKAEESDRLKSAFLANISHEIRTPMNGILGFSELLNSPDLSPENQQNFIEAIGKSGQRMLNIINDLLDISKIEAGEASVRIRKTNVNRLLQKIHLFFMSEVDQKMINVDYHCELAEEDSNIETDGNKLNQILTNLIKNAVKFTKEGSINFGYKRKGLNLEFYVSDTGTGIPPDQKDLIFEIFRQGTISLSKINEGAGLGLPISKAYVELLGGSLRVESELGRGSTFLFELPIIHPNK